MLSVIACLILRSDMDPVSFMEQSRKAIVAQDHGAWTLDIVTADRTVSSMVLRDHDDRFVRASVDGKVVSESAITKGNLLYVSYADRTYYRAPAWPMSAFDKPGDDEAVKENEFRFVLSAERGFSFVIRPALTHVEVKTSGNQETMTGELTHADGEKRGTLSYTRDEATKLPILAKLETSDGTVTFRFHFDLRKVNPDEMTIPVSRFIDFTMIDPPKKSSGQGSGTLQK